MPDVRKTDALNGTSLLLVLLRQHWLVVAVLCVGSVLACLGFQHSFYDAGYAPQQPIAFPHYIHAGQLGIDCKYCHFNAVRGKHAGIPPMSVCLGCHGLQNGQVAADKPAIKLLNQIAMTGTYASDPSAPSKVQYDGGVFHWARVHKLPDFVYFPHKWHIAAGVACQTCHGPIEKEAVVYQYANLNMGWCLNCHRNNNYVGHYAGGPGYDPTHPDPTAFHVGTYNYDIQRLRVKPDEIVRFYHRQTAGTVKQVAQEHQEGRPTSAEAKAHPQTREVIDAHVGPERTWTTQTTPAGVLDARQALMLKQLEVKYPAFKNMPRWRVVDLPESHRAFYGDPNQSLLQVMQDTFQNAPTQCSTCHQ